MAEILPAFILHWNRPAECAGTAELILKQEGVRPRVVILDNGSTAANLAELRRLVPNGVEIKELGANLGWGAAFNRVLKPWVSEQNGSQFCILSAHDSRLRPGCLANLVRAADADSRLGIISPRYEDQRITSFTKLRGIYLKEGAACADAEPMPAPHGTLMLVRRACLAEIGFFDERYFAYGDEYDLGLRAGRAGWKVAIIWSAMVINPETSTPGPLVRYLVDRNSLLLVRDFAGRTAAGVRAMLMLLNAIRIALREGLFDPKTVRIHFKARCRAIADFYLGNLGKPSPSMLPAPPGKP